MSTEPEFRKSSYSSTGNCVEVGFRRSSFCGNGACVEVDVQPDAVLVRDSKDRDGAVLTFTADEWSAFVQGVEAGEFPAGSGGN
jgi:hypothetical protein